MTTAIHDDTDTMNLGNRVRHGDRRDGELASEASSNRWMVTRRDVLRGSVSALAGWAVPPPEASAKRGGVRLRFGMVTDPHYADTAPRGTRHYRESAAKMRECVAFMNQQDVAFLIELGDFKDEDNPPAEASTLRYLDTIESVFSRFRGPRYHVLGNHDLDSISKAQFSERILNTGIPRGRTAYSFDAQGLHFVVLDANYRRDGTDYDHGNFHWTDTNIPDCQLDWLKDDLAAATAPTVVFVHQLLDGSEPHRVRNAVDVRNILQKSTQVRAVFSGHYHPGHHGRVGGIHYYTLRAMVEGSGPDHSAYAIVEMRPTGDLVVTGYRMAASRHLGRAHRLPSHASH